MTQSSTTKNELYLAVANCISNIVWLRQDHNSVEGRLATGHAIKVTCAREKVAISVWQPCNSVTKYISYGDIVAHVFSMALRPEINCIVQDAVDVLTSRALKEKPIPTPLTEYNDDHEGSM